MSKKVEIVLDSDGIKEFLKSDDVVQILKDEADKITAEMPGDWNVGSYVGTNRANVSIGGEDVEEADAEALRDTLLGRCT